MVPEKPTVPEGPVVPARTVTPSGPVVPPVPATKPVPAAKQEPVRSAPADKADKADKKEPARTASAAKKEWAGSDQSAGNAHEQVPVSGQAAPARRVSPVTAVLADSGPAQRQPSAAVPGAGIPGTGTPGAGAQETGAKPQLKTPTIERALSGKSRDRNLSWRGAVRVVTSNTQGPATRDQEALDRARARLPLKQAKRVLVLGCTSGAGQTVTTLMTGHILASLREHPVAAVDLNDGTLARYQAPAAQLDDVLRGQAPEGTTSPRPDGLSPSAKDSEARLDVIASRDPLRDGEEVKLSVQLGRHYPLTMLDPGAHGLPRLLKITDQLVIVVPASVEAASALADTREWLDAHGFGELVGHSVTLINGVSRRSLADVEAAESVARGRCRAIVRVPWDEMLPVGAAGPSTLRPQTRVAYTALAGVLVAGMAAAPVRAAK